MFVTNPGGGQGIGNDPVPVWRFVMKAIRVIGTGLSIVGGVTLFFVTMIVMFSGEIDCGGGMGRPGSEVTECHEASSAMKNEAFMEMWPQALGGALALGCGLFLIYKTAPAAPPASQ
jgi:hypothetical protein